MHALTANHCDQGGSASRWMESLGEMHQGNRGGNGHGCSQPGLTAQPLEGSHPDKGGKNMTTEQIPRLGQGAADGAVDEHGRGTEGADDHHQVGLIEQFDSG